MIDLNIAWFILIGVLLAGYAILDGFDLGVGALYLFSGRDEDRRRMLGSIAPFWDGNEVWLVTGGGALFAAFPKAYATVFSGFYLAFILLLFALIFRAVSLEFRGKQPMAWWKKIWDAGFGIASILASFLLGVVLGNLVWGIPLTAEGEYSGTLLGALHPYTILTGLGTVALFAVHGGLYLILRTDGPFRDELRERVKKVYGFLALCYGILLLATAFFVPHMRWFFVKYPAAILILLANVFALVNILPDLRFRRDRRAFLSSCALIATLMALIGFGMFPYLVYSAPKVEWSLTLYNAASSPKTLSIMLVIAAVGMPLVIAYTAFVYWVFRGKTRPESSLY